MIGAFKNICVCCILFDPLSKFLRGTDELGLEVANLQAETEVNNCFANIDVQHVQCVSV